MVFDMKDKKKCDKPTFSTRVEWLYAYFRMIGSLLKWCHEFMFSHTLKTFLIRSFVGFFFLSFTMFYASNNRILKFYILLAHKEHIYICEIERVQKKKKKNTHVWNWFCSGFLACHFIGSWHKLLIFRFLFTEFEK